MLSRDRREDPLMPIVVGFNGKNILYYDLYPQSENNRKYKANMMVL